VSGELSSEIRSRLQQAVEHYRAALDLILEVLANDEKRYPAVDEMLVEIDGELGE